MSFAKYQVDGYLEPRTTDEGSIHVVLQTDEGEIALTIDGWVAEKLGQRIFEERLEYLSKTIDDLHRRLQ